MSDKWIWNPKTEGSGVITCIPQTGKCPVDCPDCYFQSGRSYLEPLSENLPHVPTVKMASGRVKRFNDGLDSNIKRSVVEQEAKRLGGDYYFHTAIAQNLSTFSGPFILTVNGGHITDKAFHALRTIPPNLMCVFVRTNPWNLNVVDRAIEHYTSQKVPVIIIFMAYFETKIPFGYRRHYEWKVRVKNPYWCLKKWKKRRVADKYIDNPYVYVCGYKSAPTCDRCGHCIREFHVTKERLRLLSEAKKEGLRLV